MQRRKSIRVNDVLIVQNEYGVVMVIRNNEILKSIKVERELNEEELKRFAGWGEVK